MIEDDRKRGVGESGVLMTCQRCGGSDIERTFTAEWDGRAWVVLSAPFQMGRCRSSGCAGDHDDLNNRMIVPRDARTREPLPLNWGANEVRPATSEGRDEAALRRKRDQRALD